MTDFRLQRMAKVLVHYCTGTWYVICAKEVKSVLMESCSPKMGNS